MHFSRRYALSAVLSVALIVAVLWSALNATSQSGIDVTNAIATLVPAVAGGASFKYYKHIGTQADALRRDLLRITKALAAHGKPVTNA